LTFSLGTQRYAISIDEVVEVAAMVEVTKVAGMPPQVLGVINRHGTVLPLIDLRPMLRQSGGRINPSMLFIVGVSGDQHVGLLVDDVHQVEYLSLNDASPAKLGEAYIQAIVPHQSELVQIIRLLPLLNKVLPQNVNG
jgi:purine-binding chemotaxis protein CheW